jgi:hypothetical protein
MSTAGYPYTAEPHPGAALPASAIDTIEVLLRTDSDAEILVVDCGNRDAVSEAAKYLRKLVEQMEARDAS